MKKQFKVVGLRTVKYYDEDSMEENNVSTSEIFLLEDADKLKYELRFDSIYVDCYGGGLDIDVSFTEVSDFIGEKHYIPDNLTGYFIELPMDEDELDIDNGFKCDLFEYCPVEDCYYPDAELTIDYSKFMRTIRYKYNRVVYIFRGESGIGKTYIGSFINQREDVFETDKEKGKLPFEITSNFIILGNKHGYTIEDIIDKIPDKDTCEIVTVDLNKFEIPNNKETDMDNVIPFKRK